MSVYNVITGVIDGQLGAQAAIEAARFLPGRDPGGSVRRRARGSRSKIDFLARRCRTSRRAGHRFQKIGRKGEVRYGYAAAIVVDVANQRVEGGAEPRRSHAAIPFEKRSTTR